MRAPCPAPRGRVPAAASSPLRLVLLVGMAVGASGCPGLTAHTYADAANRWQAGDRPGALASARAVYGRFVRDNGVSPARVEALERRARAVLDDTPVWDTPLAAGPPGDVGRAHRLGGDPDALTRRLRADLLSGRLTPTLRAVTTVETLGLMGEARGLLAVVFRRPAFEGGAELLPGATVAERSLVAKRAALRALDALLQGAPEPPPGGLR